MGEWGTDNYYLHIYKTVFLKISTYSIYILLARREGRTGRISARGLDSTDLAALGPYKKDQRPIFSQCSPEQAWLIRDLLHDWKLPFKRICILKIATRKILIPENNVRQKF